MIARNRKGIVALLGGLATWGVAAGADGTYSQVELWGLLAVAATVFGVWGVTNAPPEPPEAGGADLGTVLIAAAVTIVILAIWTLWVR